MFKCAESKARLVEMGQAGSRRIAEWGPARFGENLARAVDKALEAPMPRANCLDRILLRLVMKRHGF